MHTHILNRRTPPGYAFSLVEVQVAIAVMAIMAAIAVPHVCRISDQARTSKERANARNVNTTAAAATTAGRVFSDLDTAVEQLTQDGGVVVVGGPYAGNRYGVSLSSLSEAEAVKQHLRFESGHLTLVPQAARGIGGPGCR